MRRRVGVKLVLYSFCWTWFSPCRVCILSPPFHSHSRERFCSLGASWVFPFQPVLHLFVHLNFHLFDRSWARQLTQSPELGVGLLLPFAEDFDSMLPPAAGIALWLLLCSGSYSSPLTHK